MPSQASDFILTDVSPALLSARVQVRNPAQLHEVAARLRANPAVATVRRERWLYPHGRPVPAREAGVPASQGSLPDDPLYPNQSWHYAMIDLPRAWSHATGSRDFVVAVVDNGIRFDHPAIAANLTGDGYDFVAPAIAPLCAGGSTSNTGDGDGYDPDPTIPIDYDVAFDQIGGACLLGPSPFGGHGLHTAGTIGAVGNDALGVTGVNWTIRIRPVRVLGLLGGSDFDVAQGILYAAGLPASDGRGGILPLASPGARIINISLGGSCGDPGQPDLLHDAVAAATSNGALVVASAGNEASESASCPAAYPEVISVSAVGPSGLLAGYSSYGSTIDVAAPGGDLSGNDGTFGVLSTTCDFTVTPCRPDYARYFGTSMAAPHVSGVAALLLAVNPGLTGPQLRDGLLDFAAEAGDQGPDPLYGVGIVNARNSLTRTLIPPAQLWVRLYDAATGALLGAQPAAEDGSFTFSGVADGSYWVFAGEDEDGDGRVGLPGRRWGAFGGTAMPTAVAVSSTRGATAFFPVGYPTEVERNDDPPRANRLIVGGYLLGSIDPSLDPGDFFRLDLPQRGTYVFETSGGNGAFCRFALDLNTTLTLEDSTGATLAFNDDIDPQDPPPLVGNRCSRVTATLAPGSYYLLVSPGPSSLSGVSAGRYRIEARVGP